MTPVLQIEHLVKSFGKRKVLCDISFDSYGGEVFGFLGPNGAGKTTAIKIIVGLLSLDEGNIRIAGYDLKKDFEKAMANVGAIVENPEFYKYLSGWDNLKLYANMRDGVSDARIKEVVHAVGLDMRIHDKVEKYSLGMRQRLGVAQALMHRPKLLILDEPTNGLDPAGIKELRDILKRMAHEEGVAVMVSSHLMSEMELMCDRVGVIVNGTLRSVQPVAELISSVSPDHEEYVFHVSTPEKAAEILAELLPEGAVNIPDEEHMNVVLEGKDCREMLSKINGALVLGGVALYTVSKKENRKLEDVFIELTDEGGGQIV